MTPPGIDIVREQGVMAGNSGGPTEKGLAEVVELAKANVRSATFSKAAIVEGRYALTFRGAFAKERALDEMEGALNAFRHGTADATGIRLQFE